jgi:hypothetical protein
LFAVQLQDTGDTGIASVALVSLWTAASGATTLRAAYTTDESTWLVTPEFMIGNGLSKANVLHGCFRQLPNGTPGELRSWLELYILVPADQKRELWLTRLELT